MKYLSIDKSSFPRYYIVRCGPESIRKRRYWKVYSIDGDCVSYFDSESERNETQVVSIYVFDLYKNNGLLKRITEEELALLI